MLHATASCPHRDLVGVCALFFVAFCLVLHFNIKFNPPIFFYLLHCGSFSLIAPGKRNGWSSWMGVPDVLTVLAPANLIPWHCFLLAVNGHFNVGRGPFTAFCLAWSLHGWHVEKCDLGS